MPVNLTWQSSMLWVGLMSDSWLLTLLRSLLFGGQMQDES